MLPAFRKKINASIDLSSLAAYRIAFGFCLLLHSFYYYQPKKILSDFGFTRYFFSFTLFDRLHLPVLDTGGFYLLFTLMGISAFMVMAGMFYRFSLTVLLLTQLYIFLLEKSYFPDPNYLYILITFLLLFTSAGRRWSFDTLVRPSQRRDTIPFWEILILRAQFFVVYFFSGFSKLIHPDWLNGRQLSIWLNHLARTSPVPDAAAAILSDPRTALLFSWGGMIFDLTIGFLLINRPTRRIGIALALFFHLFNKWMLGLYLVPWFVLAGTIVFLEPDTPRRAVESARRFLFNRLSSPERAQQPEGGRTRSLPLAVFFCLYFLIQMTLPFRPFLYPGSSSWTREGLRFSWHLMNDNFLSRMTVFYSKPPETGCVDPQPFNRLQTWWMSGNPEMILQYAHYLRDELRVCGVEHPEVFVDSRIALNGRDFYPLIDVSTNLADATYPLFKTSPWILPHPDIQAKHTPPETDLPFRSDLIEYRLKQEFQTLQLN